MEQIPAVRQPRVTDASSQWPICSVVGKHGKALKTPEDAEKRKENTDCPTCLFYSERLSGENGRFVSSVVAPSLPSQLLSEEEFKNSCQLKDQRPQRIRPHRCSVPNSFQRLSSTLANCVVVKLVLYKWHWHWIGGESRFGSYMSNGECFADVDKFLAVSLCSPKLQRHGLTARPLEAARSVRVENVPPTASEGAVDHTPPFCIPSIFTTNTTIFLLKSSS